MWKYLAIQGLLFFLFFQPDLVGSLLIRVFLIIVAVTSMITTLLYGDMDPFVWVLYCIAIILTYLTAQKALRWVSVNRQQMREELQYIQMEVKEHVTLLSEKNRQVDLLQSEISHVAHIYDKIKEMSRSLDFLDAFVTLSELLIDNFDLSKARLLLLKKSEHDKLTIEKVYQLDQKTLELGLQDRTVVSDELVYRGEIYPFDVKLIEAFKVKASPILHWSEEETNARKFIDFPDGIQSLIAHPVSTDDGLAGILTLEGISKKDYLSIEILIDRFMSEFQRIKLYSDVQRLAITDWLTGAFVRRYFFSRLEEEIARSARFNLKFSFLMLDLDDFKACNDHYGHLVGDAILKQTAKLIVETLREVDLVGRYGGEEFAAILLDTDQNGAIYVAERIRKGLETHTFKVYDLELRMTVSIGVATYSHEIRETTEIVEWADSALYQAKRQGKNRVCAYLES